MIPNAADALAHARLAVNDGGETIIYKPAVTPAAPRPIKGIVRRQEMQPINESGGTAPLMTICVVNDATYGVTDTELNRGGDMMNVAKRLGGTAEDFSIVGLADHNASFCWLEIR